MPAAKPITSRPMTSTTSTLRRSGSPPRPRAAPRTPAPPPARRSAAGAPCRRARPPIAGAPISQPLHEVDVPVAGLDRGRQGADDADRGERGARGLALLVAEPEHQQRDDDRARRRPRTGALNAPAAVAIAARRASRDGHRGAYYGGCPLPPQTRSRRRCARCATSPGRRRVFCDIDGTLAPIVRARRGRPRARGGVAPAGPARAPLRLRGVRVGPLGRRGAAAGGRGRDRLRRLARRRAARARRRRARA